MPIINQPQVAILGVGTIEKRPVVIDDAIAIRPMAYLTLGYDHRIIDGAVADEFMSHIKQTIENWDPRLTGVATRVRRSTCGRSKSVGSAWCPTTRRWRCSARWSRSVSAGPVGDLLLLVEHPHVLTLGVRGDGGRSHILATPDDAGCARRRGPRNRPRRRHHLSRARADRRLSDHRPEARSLRRAPVRPRSRRSPDSHGGRLRHRSAARRGPDRRLGRATKSWRPSACGSRAGSPVMGSRSTSRPTSTIST